jgi:tetratricopeptide (TPR) repeat protein
MNAQCRALPLTTDTRPRDAFPEAKRAATRALELDPDQADAHVALGSVAFWWDWNGRAAEHHLRHAIELQPNSVFAHLYLGHVLSNVDRGSEAVAEAQRARELDPAWRLLAALEGQFLFFARRYQESVTRLDAALELEPTMWQAHLMRAYPLIELSRLDEAIEECDKAYELSGGQLYSLALRGYALARLGRIADANAVLRQLETLSGGRYVPPHHVALVGTPLAICRKRSRCSVGLCSSAMCTSRFSARIRSGTACARCRRSRNYSPAHNCWMCRAALPPAQRHLTLQRDRAADQ